MEVLSSTSSNPSPRMTYDVFVSFRGEDTRNNFVGFLYEALRQWGIMTFMDDKKLQIGDELHENLVRAIEESRSSIVVISKGYASSKWCLRELAKIIDCMAETTHRVLPVFFHVDPSEVRHQSGNFKKSFDEHQVTAQNFTDEQKEKYLKEVQKWRDSMTKISHLSGPVVTKHSPEIDIIKKITNQIFDTWRPKLVASDKKLVGMTSRLLQMNVQLGLGLDDVRFIGIVGMGGIGKTTIAKIVYDCIITKFEGSCFLHISRGSSKQSNLVSLQDQLLSRLVLKENIRIWDEHYGAEMIKDQLCGRKILLVLDGVEERSQLEMLAGSPNWFGPGSRVIITTRNKNVLHQPYKIREYDVELLDAGNALRLFCNHAFGIDYTDNNFMDLSKEIVEKVGRLPLALKVIGSYLNKKDEVIWKETLNRLIKIDEKYFFDILKISYDGLGAESQKVFLDLACFFHGRRKDRVTKILERFGCSPHSEIHLLKERSLIEVSQGKIMMHDSIVAMGQEIVQRESLTQPGKQSRIWLREDVDRLFAVKHGLKYTEGIVLNLEEKQEELILEAKPFAGMTSLRILEINNVQLSEDIQSLSNLLALLNWPGFPSKCLPSNFQSRYLFELHLPGSNIVQLWEGKKKFEKLKVIDVSDSEHLLETPDFSEVPNLERLVLCNCRKLYHIHPSINSLEHLIFLNLRECWSLKSFSSNLRCKNLKILVLSKSGLTSFPEIEGNMEHLAQLHLDNTLIQELHSSIGRLAGLVFLYLRNCVMLSSLPSEIGNLRSLKTLNLHGCKNLYQIPPSLGKAESLEDLDIGETSISHAPPTIHCLKSLESLNCDGLSRSVWHSLLPVCRSDSEISDSKLFSHSFGLRSLQQLSLRGCNLVDEDIPKDLHCFSSLLILDLSKNCFIRLPKSINHLENLQLLKLNDCINLQQIPEPPANLVVVATPNESRMPAKDFFLPNQDCRCKHILLELKAKGIVLNPKVSEEAFLKGSMFSFISDNAEVFECFDETHEGHWIEVQYDQESSVKNDIYGVVFSAYIQCLHNTNTDQKDVTFYCKSFIGLEIDDNPRNLGIPCSWTLTSRTKVWMLYIPFEMLPQTLYMQNSFCFKAAISCESSVKVERCGVSILSRQYAPDQFLVKMFTKMYCNQNKFKTINRGSNQGSEARCNEQETVEDYCSSPVPQSVDVESESDSFSLLKRNLKSNLRRTFEEGKHNSPYYFFPQGEISGWFKIQQPKDTVVMKLPQRLHKDKKWMGLATFAVFSLQELSESICHYAFCYQIKADGEGDQYLVPYFPIPLEYLEYSRQILYVSFKPREQIPYELNEWNHLYFSFITNAATMRVELCGARLVYQQNVEGLIQTIVDCVLKSGEKLHRHYSLKVLNDLLRTFHRPRWNVHPSREIADRPTTSTSNDAGRGSFEQLLYESFPHPLFNMSIQERYESKFDVILHGKEIPKLFACRQSTGNEGAVRVHVGDGVGFLACALVAVKKQIRKTDKTHEPLETCVRVLDLLCEFGVDSEEVRPVRHHFVSEEKLLRQYETQFVWLFYTPLASFDIPFRCWNYLKTKLTTSNEELFCVQQCGIHLVRKTERKMIDNLLMSLLPQQP